MSISRVDTAAQATPEVVDAGTNTQMDQMDFLKLLTVQLANQDPMNPMDNSEFVSQQTTFAQLEQLMNLNSKMENFVDSQESVFLSMASAFNTLESSSYLGRGVSFFSDEMVLNEDGSHNSLYYDLTESAFVGFSIKDEAGNTVRASDAELVSPGEKIAIDVSEAIDDLPAGQYTVSLDVTNLSGQAMSGKTYTQAKVSSVDYRGDVPQFILDDGRKLGVSDVFAVVDSEGIGE